MIARLSVIFLVPFVLPVTGLFSFARHLLPQFILCLPSSSIPPVSLFLPPFSLSPNYPVNNRFFCKRKITKQTKTIAF